MMDIWPFLFKCKRSITLECGLLVVVGFKQSGMATSHLRSLVILTLPVLPVFIGVS